MQTYLLAVETPTKEEYDELMIMLDSAWYSLADDTSLISVNYWDEEKEDTAIFFSHDGITLSAISYLENCRVDMQSFAYVKKAYCI